MRVSGGTTFYPLIAESLKETEGQPKQIRRARAMEYLLDNVELEVFPHELLGGSILGMWPVEPVHREYSDLLIQAEQFVEEYINPRKRLKSQCTSMGAAAS